ncbi:hypothetical protein HispidOSU_023245, partial [Sigmodon hispidus]
ITHNAKHPEGTWVFVEEQNNRFGFFTESRHAALQSGFIGDSYNTEALLVATFSFRERFS